ncbi:MAG: LacI family transcriptional regulator [Chloroflexi bacterium]|nr:MAG: LacI family transcriptional regulator [Chloroflexota bacterium]
MEAVSGSAITLAQVARLAGVSRTTAFRVFSDNPAVSQEARAAVERAAVELGYVPNRAAKSLVAGRSESVGVVIPEPRSGLLLDPLFPRLLRGIGEELSASGLQMVLFAPQSTPDIQRLEQYLAGGHVDAVILLTFHDSDTLSARLQARGIPVIYGGRPPGRSDVSFVDVDNHAGGLSATEHLIAQGRRRIAHIAGPVHSRSASDRAQGFREAMWNSALRSDLVAHGEMDRDSGEVAMSRLLAESHEIDAVFAASDAMAAGAMWAMQVLGRRVPDDVAIIGFDDSPLATATRPPLSSVRQPIEDMGREMTRLVVNMSGARKQEPQHMILGPELQIRQSTLAAAG